MHVQIHEPRTDSGSSGVEATIRPSHFAYGHDLARLVVKTHIGPTPTITIQYLAADQRGDRHGVPHRG